MRSTTLEELQVIITAETAGLKKEVASLKGQLGGLSNSASNMSSKINNAFRAIKTSIAVIAIKKVADALIDCTNTAGKTETALLGLERILTAQGRSFGQANGFIKQYISDGLVPLQDAIVTYKNLASRGYDDKQIQDIMTRLKDSASFGRQANLSLGEAVKTASEGLKNENSILVDNAGVTKNVAKMWEEYADSVGKSRNDLTLTEKRIAEYNGIMQETKFQIGDAAAYTQTYDGQVARLGATFTTIKTNIGEAFMPIATVVLPLLQSLANALAQLTSFIASFVKALFGVGGSQKAGAGNAQAVANANNNAAGAMDKAGGSAEKSGKKAKKAAKDAQGALAAFDEVNQLNLNKGGHDSDGGGSGGDKGEGGGKAGGLSPVSMEDTGLNKIPDEAQKLADRIKGVFADLGSWFSSIGSLFSPGIETLQNMFKQDFEDIKTFLTPLESAFEDIGNRWVESINYRIPIFAEAFNTIAEILNAVHREIFGTLVLNSQTFADSVRQMFIAAFDFGDAIYQPIMTVFTQVVALVLPIWGDLASRILQIFFDLFNALSNVFTAGLQPLQTIVVMVFTNISNWLTENSNSIRNGMSKAFEDIQVRISAAINGISKECIRIFGDLDKFFIENSGLINKTLTNTWDTIRDMLKNTWTIISTVAFGIFDSLRDFFSKHIDEIHKRLMETWDVIAKGVMNVWNSLLKTANEIFGQLAKWFTQNSGDIKKVLTDTWETIWKVIEPVWKIINDVARTIFQGLADFFNDNSKAIGKFITEAWNLIWSVLKPLWELILSTAKVVFGALKEFWNIWGTEITSLLTNIFKGVSDVFGGLLKSLTGLFEIFSGLFTGNWSKMWQGCKDIFGGIFDCLGGIFKTAMNVVIGCINGVISLLDKVSVDVPDWVPGIGGNHYGISIPKVPYLAQGGIIDKPTMAMVGEAGPEAVVPLKNTPFVGAIASAVGSSVMAAMQFAQPTQQTPQGTGDIILQVDGTTFARIIGPYANQESQRIGNDLIIQTV